MQAAWVLGVPLEELAAAGEQPSQNRNACHHQPDQAAPAAGSSPAAWQSFPALPQPAAATPELHFGPGEATAQPVPLQQAQAKGPLARVQQEQQPGLLSPATASATQAAAAGSPLFWQPLRKALPGSPVDEPATSAAASAAPDGPAAGLLRSFQASSGAPLHTQPPTQSGLYRQSSGGPSRPASALSPSAPAADQCRGQHWHDPRNTGAPVEARASAQQPVRHGHAGGQQGAGGTTSWESFPEEPEQDDFDDWRPFEGAPTQSAPNGHQVHPSFLLISSCLQDKELTNVPGLCLV